jgi:hypothetical protein
MNKTVRRIENKATYPFLLNIHYAKRIPSISYAFGLFDDEELIGVITYGTPMSSTLRKHVCGAENMSKVLELNRLCLLNNQKNEASFLISKSLKLLPAPSVVVSFADPSQGHSGIVYQATNFGYYGLSEKRTDWKIKGMEHLHSQTISDIVRGKHGPERGARVAAIREMFGDRFYLAPRTRKHRYIIVTGKGLLTNSLVKSITYKKQDYPKKSLKEI